MNYKTLLIRLIKSLSENQCFYLYELIRNLQIGDDGPII